MPASEAARGFLQAYWLGDLAAALACCCPDAVIELARSLPIATPAPVGEILPVIFDTVYPRFVGGRFSTRIDTVCADGDIVAVEYQASGQLLSGTPFDCRYAAFFSFRGDRIARIRMYTDTRYVADTLMS